MRDRIKQASPNLHITAPALLFVVFTRFTIRSAAAGHESMARPRLYCAVQPADMALYHIKRHGKNGHCFFEDIA